MSDEKKFKLDELPDEGSEPNPKVSFKKILRNPLIPEFPN
jgi:hypothetical protein